MGHILALVGHVPYLSLLDHRFHRFRNTPFVPSKFPGAGSVRICTASRLSYTPPPSATSPPITFTLLNTHLDDQSDSQRKLGASLILTRAKFEALRTGGVVLITGDFNRYYPHFSL